LKENKQPVFVLFIVLILLLVPSTLAISNLGYFKTNTDVNLIQTCATCTYNNVSSVISPTSELLIQDQAMSQSGTDFFYTLDQNYTSSNGVYLVNGVGDLDGVDTVWTYSFEVNPSGQELSKDQNLIAHTAAITILIIFFSFVGYFGFKRLVGNERKVDKYSLSLVIIGFSMALFQLLYLVYITASRESGYLVSNILNNNFNVILVVTLGLVLYSLFIIIIKLVNFEDVMEDDEEGKW